MPIWLRLFASAALALLLAGCATLSPGFEPPTVDLIGIEPAASGSFEQRMQLTLRVINPNRQSLNIRGISYSLSLQGHKVVTGVSNRIPVIAGYGEATVTVDAATSILGGLQVLRDLIASPKQKVSYELAAKFDIRGRLTPLKITETGTIDLPQPTATP